jgi:acetyltransferase-like isoleucine patch superfamily enzyme
LNQVRLRHDDPLATFERNRENIAAQLRASANRAGRDVIVGRDVVIWGGLFRGGIGLELHDSVRLYDSCRLVIDQVRPESGIVLETGVALNFNCYIDGSGGVRIRRRTIVGPNVVILSSGHQVHADTAARESAKEFDPVDIGEDVWIGANVVVLKDITVGNDAIVGAGSIVTHNVPARAVVAGNPARVLRIKDDPLQTSPVS